MKIIDEELLTLEQRYKRLKHDNEFTHSISNSQNKPKTMSQNQSQSYEIPSDFDVYR